MNILHEFEYHRPTTKAETLRLAAQLGDSAKILAGGTDLMIHLKENMVETDHIIDINGVAEFSGIRCIEGKGAEIGAMTRIDEMEHSEALAEKFRALPFAAGQIGSCQVRSMGTIGGNCCNASPCADTVATLSAYAAEVVICSEKGERRMAIEDFILGNRSIALEPGEMVTGFVLPEPEKQSACCYDTIGLRDAMEIDLANMAVKIVLEDDRETIRQAKAVMGSVYYKPLVSEMIPELLKGQKLTGELLDKVGEVAQYEAKPISDVRASAEYRRDVIRVLARNTVKRAYQMAKEAR